MPFSLGKFDGGDGGDGLSCDGGCSFVFGAESEETWVLDVVSCVGGKSKPTLGEVLLSLGFLELIVSPKSSAIGDRTYSSGQGVLDCETCGVTNEVVGAFIGEFVDERLHIRGLSRRRQRCGKG